MNSTVEGAVQIAAGGAVAAGAAPAVVSTLTQEVLKAMFLTKLKISAAALLAAGAASSLAVVTVGFTQEKPVAAPATTPVSPRTKAILAKLDEPIAMSFANETPLDDVLKYIKQATTTPTFPGIPIVVDALGLQEVKKTLESTVSIDLEGVSLKTTLHLLLEQLGLVYTIKDGLVVISSPKVIGKLEGRMGDEPR
jgi:hypothetical protein